jgi:glycosyltransferase involved in cell wall biosynthesis
MAAEVPLVTSNSGAAREYFTRGTIFVENTPEAISRGLREAIETRETLRQQMRDLKRERSIQCSRQVAELMLELEGFTS